MTLYVKDTDIEVRGTLESVKGVALASGIDADGSPIYMGGTHPQSRIEDRP